MDIGGSHSDQGRVESSAIQPWFLGESQVSENVAVGYSSAKAFVVGWLGSKGHRDNIMNSSYTRTGIGYFDGYATQVFCD